MQLDPLVLPDDWTPDQAFAVAEFLIALHDAIWDGYGWAMRDALSAPTPSALPTQLELPLHDTGERPVCASGPDPGCRRTHPGDAITSPLDPAVEHAEAPVAS